MEKIKIPRNLGRRGREFWVSIIEAFVEWDVQDLPRLAIACRCLDEMESIENTLKSDGFFVRNRYGGVSPHPGFKMLHTSRSMFIRTVRELGLDIETPQESPRPPKLY